MSLRGGLLRLMMTGIIIVVGGTNIPFLLQFVIAEFIAIISVHYKEILLMCIKTFGEIKSLVNKIIEMIKQSLVCHLSYRFNLLMNW